MADVETSDFVRSAAERDRQRRLIEWLLGVIGLGEDRQARHEQRHVARALFGETHHHGAAIHRLGAFAVAQRLRDDRMALVFQRIQRPCHVMRGERRAVVEFGFGAQGKTIGQTVVGDADALGCKPVHRVGLVARTRHERGECGVHAEGARAFQNVRIKRVEGEKGAVVAATRHRFRIDAALRRGCIDVIEVRKISRIGKIAKGRHAVAIRVFCGVLRSRRRELCGGDRAGRQHKRVPTGDQDRCGTLAALSASHHQIMGNADSPYFGISGGRLKRSQRAVRCLP